MPEIFHDHKNPPVPPPIYLMYGPLDQVSVLVGITLMVIPLFSSNGDIIVVIPLVIPIDH